MATKLQRVQAIADALINKAATQAQLTNMVGGYVGPIVPPNPPLTPAQKMDVFLAQLREHIITRIKDTTAISAVAAAKQTSDGQVDTEFGEAP